MSGPRQRIAYIDHAQELGGAEHSLLDLLARLDRDRFEPLLVHCADAAWVEKARELGVQCEALLGMSEIYRLRRDEIQRGLWRNFQHAALTYQEARRLTSELRKLELDLVHTNTLKAHVVGGLAAHWIGRPLVWHLRDILGPEPAREVLRVAGRRVRPHVICISRAVAETLPADDPPRTIIYNGTSLERFCPRQPSAALREELGIPTGGRVLTIVSRLTPWKGHVVLLRAMRQVLARHSDTTLLIVGEAAFWNADYVGELEDLAGELGVREATRFTGYRQDIPDLLALTDVFVLPSTDEPFGRVIVEAMAMELPVVATATGGVPEIVKQGETGLLVPPEEPTVLAEAIIRLLEDGELRREMGTRGRERVLAHFDARRTVRQVQELYERLLVPA